MTRKPFVNDEYYHVHNRGVLGMHIYREPLEYMRFLSYLARCNTTDRVDLRLKEKTQSSVVSDPILGVPLVEIVAYCLMPNHFHLILRQIHENGISQFMQKLGTGYTMYFNNKHSAQGHTFQGKFKAQHIRTDGQLLWTSAYIHANPIKGRKKRFSEVVISVEHLNDLSIYPWSSLAHYMKKDYLQPLEIKYSKPPINNSIISDILTGQSYEDYILDIWKDRKYKVDRKIAY